MDFVSIVPRFNVSQYRTEFIVPPDRYLCLQLPPHLPEGKVTVTVTVHEPAPADRGPSSRPDSEPQDDLDRQDIEWWEEFEEDRGRDRSRR
jgi:hypothetical protein